MGSRDPLFTMVSVVNNIYCALLLCSKIDLILSILTIHAHTHKKTCESDGYVYYLHRGDSVNCHEFTYAFIQTHKIVYVKHVQLFKYVSYTSIKPLVKKDRGF